MARRSVPLVSVRARRVLHTAPRRRAGWLVGLALVAMVAPLGAQGPLAEKSVPTANYRLAARFAPYKMRPLVHSTSVSPRWIEGSERFWYEWETSAGKFFYLVDPAAGTKRAIFDNDRIAAELTRITKDPWDGQHLPIRKIKFLDANTLQFEVESSQDDTQPRTPRRSGASSRRGAAGTAAAPTADGPRRRSSTSSTTCRTQALRELADWEAPGQPSLVGQRLARRADRRLRAASTTCT